MRAFKNIVAVVFIFFLFSAVNFADEIDEKIAEINKAIEEQGYDWVAGRNEIAELPDHLKIRLLGLNFSMPSFDDNFFTPNLGDKQFPSYFDWRNVNGTSFVTGVRDQGFCGACWAFAVVGALESLIAIKEPVPNPDFDLSEQTLLSCTNAGNCTYGGYLNSAADALVKVGTVFEECFPYSANDTIPCEDRCDEWATQVVTASSWSWVGGSFFPPNVEVLKSAIMTAPVATGMVVYDDFYYYKGGVYQRTPGSRMLGAHAVLLIGWDDSLQCWIVKNSWGTSWGEDGFFRIKWGNSFIGTSSVLLDYTPGNFHPPQDDDDAADDDIADDDDDKESDDDDDDSGCGC